MQQMVLPDNPSVRTNGFTIFYAYEWRAQLVQMCPCIRETLILTQPKTQVLTGQDALLYIKRGKPFIQKGFNRSVNPYTISNKKNDTLS